MATKKVTYEEVLALFAEVAERQKQTAAQQKQTDEQQKKTDEQLKKTDEQLKKTDKQIKALSRELAGITNTMGLFAQEQVRLKLVELFQEKGIELEDTLQNIIVKKDGMAYYEMDLLLINTVHSVIVEVKNKVQQEDIDNHLKRLAKVEEVPHRFVKGTQVYGGIAGMIVRDDIQNYAIKQGLYVIRPKGDNVEISNPKDFEPRIWQAGVA